ncbi:unnamed protein product [Linum trigynum]|uniref:Transposase MuDR plant domain-containing protein n=1 Tax=Linum trigynum TaxID=586398 RepID=A0AAV2EW11_9ROSI
MGRHERRRKIRQSYKDSDEEVEQESSFESVTNREANVKEVVALAKEVEQEHAYESIDEVEVRVTSRSVSASIYRESLGLDYDEEDGPIYNLHCEPSLLNIIVGLKFGETEQFKFVETTSCIKWNISTSKKKRVVCRGKCGWYVFVS